jgi:capsule polysaccharide export protein KpsE/RkpR
MNCSADESVAAPGVFHTLALHWKLVAAAPVVFGVVGVAVSFLVTPRFSSHTLFIPPQQQSGSSALASLNSLASLAGAAGAKNTVDQYVSLLQSDTVTDHLIDRFKLLSVYEVKFRDEARKELARHTSVFAGKKDGLITVDVEDVDPGRAAAIANQYVEELRHLTSTLAVSEAQQRRMFFENQMQAVKQKLVLAQDALQRSGIGAASLKAEPRVATESYAKLRADLAAAQVRLDTLRSSLADSAPAVREQSATVAALQSQIHALEGTASIDSNDPDYTSKYREFKYEETLFDLMAKQYEVARVDESREGALIQVVDPARPAERKSFPKRSMFGAIGALIGTLVVGIWLVRRPGRGRP